MDAKMMEHSHYPLNDRLHDVAGKIAPMLAEKVRRGQYTVDVQGMMTTFNIGMGDVKEIVAWYEDGLLSTEFELINFPENAVTGLPN